MGFVERMVCVFKNGKSRIGGVFMDGQWTGGVFLNCVLGGVFMEEFRMGTVLAVGRSFGRGRVSTTPEYPNHFQVSREPPEQIIRSLL